MVLNTLDKFSKLIGRKYYFKYSYSYIVYTLIETVKIRAATCSPFDVSTKISLEYFL